MIGFPILYIEFKSNGFKNDKGSNRIPNEVLDKAENLVYKCKEKKNNKDIEFYQ